MKQTVRYISAFILVLLAVFCIFCGATGNNPYLMVTRCFITPDSVLKDTVKKNTADFSQFQTMLKTETAENFCVAQKGVLLYRNRISSLGFVKDYLVAWVKGKDAKEELMQNIIRNSVGLSCEVALAKSERIYKNYCRQLEKNIHEEIKLLYDTTPRSNQEAKVSLVENYRQELASSFSNQQDAAFDVAWDVGVEVLFAKWSLESITSLLAGTATMPILAVGSVAFEIYDIFIKRPAKLDELARKMRHGIEEYQANLYNKYIELARANLIVANDIAKKIADNAN